jgi:hypothetical protein
MEERERRVKRRERDTLELCVDEDEHSVANDLVPRLGQLRDRMAVHDPPDTLAALVSPLARGGLAAFGQNPRDIYKEREKG